MSMPIILGSNISTIVDLRYRGEELPSDDETYLEDATLLTLVCSESRANTEQACHRIWRYGHQLGHFVLVSETCNDGRHE